MKRLLLIIACLSCGTSLWAGPITADQARQKAAQFLIGKWPTNRRTSAKAVASQLKMVSVGREDSYYIFNANEGGFAVVSGDDTTEEIFGYSRTGSINPDSMPCGMRMLLNNYAEQIKHLRANGITKSQKMLSRVKVKKAIAKSYHITSTLARYDQWEPYNAFCPENTTKYNGHKKCPTGCAATAMAQLMYYYRWPQHTTAAIPTYQSKTSGYQVDVIPSETTIDWINIFPEYVEEDNNSESGTAIANLMKMAGAAVHTDYKDNSSSAKPDLIPYALKKYFGYESAVLESASSYDWDEWLDKLRQALNNNAPIIYGGTTKSNNEDEDDSSHGFLLEGYDDEGYFDINFGWGGSHNNKFLLTNIIKDHKLVYNYEQWAILNVKPQSVLSSVDIPLMLTTTSLRPTDTYIFSRSQETGKFNNVRLYMGLYNYSPVETYFDYGLRFVSQNDDKMFFDIVIGENMRMLSLGRNGNNGDDISPDANNYKEGLEYSFDVGDEVRDGAYVIYGISRETGTNTWYVDEEGAGTAAVICKDKLVLPYNQGDRTVLSLYDFTQTSPEALRKGLSSDFCYMLENLHSRDLYDGYIIVTVQWKENGNEKEMPIYIENDVQILPAAKSKVLGFSFTPFVSGEQTIVFYNKKWEEIGSKTVNVVAANASLDKLEVTGLNLIDGDYESLIIYGSSACGEISLKNHDNVAKIANVSIGLTDQETLEDVYKSIYVNITPGSTATYDFRFANLKEGHHYIISALYASGEEFYHSPKLLCTTDNREEVEAGNDELVAYEYWFDDNLAGKKTVNLNSNSAIIKASIDTKSLSAGLHRFNFRLKRSDEKYSSVSSTLFYNLKTEKECRIDYWFDDDIENSASMPLANTESEQELALNMSDPEKFPLGFHRLNMRVATKGKSMSNIYTSHVLKVPSGEIDAIEYWVDNDFKNPRTVDGHVASNDQNAYIFVNPFDLSSVPSGPHRIYYRPTSKNGTACGAVSMASVIVGGGTPSKIEYWFDGDVTHSTTVDIPASAMNDTVDITLLMNDSEKFPLGLHQLSMRMISKDREQSPIYSARVLKKASGKMDVIEYWVDDNYSKSQTIEGHVASTDENAYVFNNTFDLSSVPSGPHRIYYRPASKDGKAYGAISMTSAIVGGGTSSKLEYWLDGDIRNTHTIEGQVVSNNENAYDFSNPLDLSDVSEGIHRVYFRATNDNGISKSSVSMTPVMVKSRFNDVSDMTVSEYSFAVDNEEPIVTPVINKKEIVDIDYSYDARNLSLGEHTLRTSIKNSIGVSTLLEHPFTVMQMEDPSITLTGWSNNDWLHLKFNTIPNDISYTAIERGTDGVERVVAHRKVSLFPEIVDITPEPITYGVVTYYIKATYIDRFGNEQELLSNEVTFQNTSPREEDIYGCIVGRIVFNDKESNALLSPHKRLYVNLNDGVKTEKVLVERNGTFNHDYIPLGTTMTLTIEDDDYYTYESVTINVDKTTRKQIQTIHATARDDVEIDVSKEYNEKQDLLVTSFSNDVPRVVEMDVVNTTQFNWTGIIELIAYKKEDNLKEMTFNPTKPYYYVGSAYIKNLGNAKSTHVSIAMEDFPIIKEQEDYLFYFLTQKEDKSNTKQYKQLAFEDNVNYPNPMLIPMYPDPEIDGVDFSDIDDFIVAVFKVINGCDTWSGPFSGAIKSLPKKIEKYEKDKDIKAFMYDMPGLFIGLSDDLRKVYKGANKALKLKPIQDYYEGIKDIIKIEEKEPFDNFLTVSKYVFKYYGKYSNDPFVGVYKLYLEAAEHAVDKIMDYQKKLIDVQLGDIFFNNDITFKIKVTKDNRLDYDNHCAGALIASRIDNVQIYLENEINQVEMATYTATGTWDNYEATLKRTLPPTQEIDKGYKTKRFWMEIKWRNGRISRFPLYEDFTKWDKSGQDVRCITLELNTDSYNPYSNSEYGIHIDDKIYLKDN